MMWQFVPNIVVHYLKPKVRTIILQTLLKGFRCPSQETHFVYTCFLVRGKSPKTPFVIWIFVSFHMTFHLFHINFHSTFIWLYTCFHMNSFFVYFSVIWILASFHMNYRCFHMKIPSLVIWLLAYFHMNTLYFIFIPPTKPG